MKKNILLLLLLFSGCIFFTKFPQVEPKHFEGNELKTNGFYYYLKKVDESGYYYKEFIPFRNGVGLIFHYSFIKANNFDDYILKMSNSIMSIKGKFSQEHWCGFYINNNKLTIKRVWGRLGETLHTYECDIINDTTFRINKEIIEGSFAENENGIDIKDEVYHFVRLPIKPDSTNKYIKPENNDF